jgi:SRSO17 transposase
MSIILEHPDAQALLEQTEVSPGALVPCSEQLTHFIQRYLPLFARQEQRDHARTILQGKLTGLQRKTTEPIATQAGQKRRPLQHFLGAGQWADPTIRTELRCHVKEQLADPEAVLVLDNHGTPKKGDDSCGVARQWCGRLGKVDNCQVGYFLAYVAPRGKALVDARLFLPLERAQDQQHRRKTYVPKEVTHQEGWRLGLELVERCSGQLPHGWVVGDDEFGRASQLRGALRLQRERYVLDVPSNTLVRDLSQRRPPSAPGRRERLALFERAEVWAARQPKKRWRSFRLAGGEKGPRQVKALQQWVQTKEEDGVVGPRERLVVIRTCEKKPRTWYTMSNAHKEVPLAEIVRARGAQHGVEELFEEGCQEVGLNHYEVRSWTGWAHHVTLTLLALWFLQLERLRLGKKKSGCECVPGASDLHGTAAREAGQFRGDCQESQPGAAPQRRVTHLPLAQPNG